MSNSIFEVDGGGVELDPEPNPDPATGAMPSGSEPDASGSSSASTSSKDNSPNLDAPPEESTNPTDEDPSKKNVGASTPDEA